MLRALVTLLGVVFGIQGLLWLVAPARAAEALGMPLLDGLARSTQIGDLAAFFLLAGGTMVWGARPGRGALLYVPAALFACAALGRTVAWLAHGAELAALFIVVELTAAALLAAAARQASAIR